MDSRGSIGGHGSGTRGRGAEVVHVVLGVGAGAWRMTRWVSRPLGSVGGELWDALVTSAPGAGVVERGRRTRAELEQAGAALVQAVAVRVVELVLDGLDLTELVLRHVDLDAVVRRVDLDAAAAGLDLDRLVATVDLDAAVGRVDLDAVVGRVDLDAAVRRVDLDAVVRRVDLNAAAAGLDLDRLVATVDLDAAVLRVDLVGIARDVIAAIDLPEIVRDSTGALSSDAVRAVRAGGMDADDLAAGFVDRLLGRRRRSDPVLP